MHAASDSKHGEVERAERETPEMPALDDDRRAVADVEPVDDERREPLPPSRRASTIRGATAR